ncbi:MAG: endonuclease III [Oxalobacter sp.]|nr:MAG: endonuclease III [Oxalobacter sp.]
MRAPKIQKIFDRFKAANPQPKTELAYTTPFELLVATMLSAQATDVSVNKATRILFPIANTPEAMVALDVEGLMPYLQTLNLYRTKTKNVVAMSQKLLDEFKGEVPGNREALVTFPGVGRKTANVVLNAAFGQPTIAVDTHIFRVSNRIGLAPGKTVEAVEQKLLKVVPKEYLHEAHHWLVLHGRYVCTARKPQCWNCLIADLCVFKPKTPKPKDV